MKQEHSNKKDLIITLKTFYGLEEVLKEELNEMGFKEVQILNRAVQVKGTWEDVYRLNYYVRCAISVLVEVAFFRIKNEDDLYKKAARIDWTEYFDNNKTFAVKGAIFSKVFRHSQYPFLLLKDAIVDCFRDKGHERPNVNVKKPQVLFDLYIRDQEVRISLNTSGAPLFQRGYRDSVGEAPLNEVVAAGLLRLSGWTPETNLYDPFCGSGTVLIEAAMRAANIPAGIERTHYAFKNFANFDATLWEQIAERPHERLTKLPCKIVGSDKSPEMMMKAKRNLRGLGLARLIDIQTEEVQNAPKPFEEGMMISNPPYGERIGIDVEDLYEEIGDWMKQTMHGCSVWLISSNMEAFKRVGLRPSRKMKVFNGDLECSFRKFDIYAGSKREKFQQNEE